MTLAIPSSRLKVARRSNVAPFMVMEVLAAANRAAADGRDVIHLEVGEPGGGTPRAVLEAARRALESTPLGYTEALGIPPLRRAIADHCRAWYGVEIDAARVAVTVGASGAFVLAFLAAFDPGDRVAVPEPAYPCYRNILEALGIEVVPLPLDPERGFKADPALLASAAGRIDGLVIASPANPTGTMLDRDELAALAAACRERGVRLVADEIYHGITYGGPAASVLELDPDAVVIGGFSKYFCMTGWRIGWMVMPAELADAIERLAQNLFISPPTPAQHAALAAFQATEELEANVARYRRNREVLLEALRAGGITRMAPPDGAFYVYADTSRLGDSREVCRRLLTDTGVAITPGLDFDRARGRDHVRLSFAGSEPDIARAAPRLTAWLRHAKG
jgi:aspartate/methionine/tyrosine aminotransferase